MSLSISAFTGTEHTFTATTSGDRAIVRHVPATEVKVKGVPLSGGGRVVLSLVVEFDCTWDSRAEYLSVATSTVRVYPLRNIEKEPLFRYEFVRDPVGRVPCAHFQVHAHRDAFTHLLGFAGDGSRRARQREAQDVASIPAVSRFHFPVGGPRFRPALEDVLDVLAEEFGIHTGSEWPAVRDEARREWRRTQLSAAVRDSPDVAARVLREMGYTVSGEPRPERDERLLMP